MKRIVAKTLAVVAGLMTVAGVGACSNSRIELPDWSAVEAGFDPLGLEWGMGADQVPSAIYGDAAPEDQSWSHSVKAFGLPWVGSLSFEDDQLYSVRLTYEEEGWDRDKALESGTEFDEAMLHLAFGQVFTHVSTLLEKSNGPAAYEYTAEDSGRHVEWDVDGAFVSLLEIEYSDSSGEVFLDFRPNLTGIWELTKGGQDFEFETLEDGEWVPDRGYGEGQLAFEFSDFDHVTVSRIIGSATMTRSLECRQSAGALNVGGYDAGVRLDYVWFKIVGDRLVMELDSGDGPTVVFERRDEPIIEGAAEPTPS
ncbi:MAG: hypothetical protein LBK95_03585 [Bifidobacteriaceae bacterium]|jgi:hypothetical protein|nr:hypothetical protein [Bifidobacteriaceae bacterium]